MTETPLNAPIRPRLDRLRDYAPAPPLPDLAVTLTEETDDADLAETVASVAEHAARYASPAAAVALRAAAALLRAVS